MATGVLQACPSQLGRMLSALFLAIAILIFGGLAASAQVIATVGEYYFWKSISKGVKEGTDSYADYKSQRLNWESNIVRLESALQACGNCPERSKLEKELAYWKGTKEAFIETTWSILDLMGSDNPAWKNGWATLLGLPQRENADGTLTDEEVIRRQRAEGTSEECIRLLERYQACRKARDLSGGSTPPLLGPCQDEMRLFQYCQSGNKAEMLKELQTQKLREAGVIIPKVEISDKQISVYYGKVPDDFVPDVLPLSELGDRTLEIYMIRSSRDSRLKEVNVWFAKYPPGAKVYPEDFSGEERRMLVEDYKALWGQRVIRCGYSGREPAPKVVFWFDKQPEAADPARLRARIKRHPSLLFGPPRGDCPLTEQEGLSAMSRSEGPRMSFKGYFWPE